MRLFALENRARPIPAKMLCENFSLTRETAHMPSARCAEKYSTREDFSALQPDLLHERVQPFRFLRREHPRLDLAVPMEAEAPLEASKD